MARKDLAQSGGMSDEGDRIKARRERLGMHKIELAKEAGVSRDTVTDIESGKGFQAATLAKIERALEQAEEEAGIEAPPLPAAETGLIEFEVEGDRVIVRGPVADKDALVEMVAKLIRETREKDQG